MPRLNGKKDRPKGILGRSWAVITGLGGATQAPLGLVKDLTFGINDDEFDGVIGTLFGASKKRGGQFLGNLFGPDEGVGAAIGGLPSGVRRAGEGAIVGGLTGAAAGAPFAGIGALPGAAAGAIAGGVAYSVMDRSAFEDVETVGREAIREPISTALTAGSLADAPGGGGLGGLLDGDTWSEAYKIAQDRSLGQSFALAVQTKDITDDNEVAKAVGTTAYQVMSGTADAIARIALEPDVLLGMGLKAGRAASALTIRSADDINKVAASPRFDKFIDALDGKSAAQVRDQYFPAHPQGALIADALTLDAEPLIRKTAARALMGDAAAREALLVDRPALGARIARLTSERSALLDYADDTLFANPERLAAVKDEIEALVPQAKILERLESATSTAILSEIPRPNQGAIRTSITRSDFYQGPFAAPLRTTFNMVPKRWTSLHDNTADVTLHRNLQGSTLDQATKDNYRSQMMAARNPMERERVFLESESAAVKKMAADAGMTVDEVEGLLNAAKGGRANAAKVLSSRSYDGKGRSVVEFVDDEGVTHKAFLPAFVTQEQNFHLSTDLDGVKKAMDRVGSWKKRFPDMAVPAELLDSAQSYWKASVLLRAGWPIRVVGEEQLRIMAMIGGLAQMKSLMSKGVPELADRTSSAVARRVPGAKNSARFAQDAVNNRALGRYSGFDTLGYEMQGAFGPVGDVANMHRGLVSSADNWDAAVGSKVGKVADKLYRRVNDYGGSIAPDAPGYGDKWAHAVNRQFGQDVVGKRLMAGEPVEDVVRWLRSTPDGRAVASRFSIRIGADGDPTEWVELMANIIDDYTGGSPALKQLALAGKATPADLTRYYPGDLPVVHGEIVAQLTGRGAFKEWVDTTISSLFDTLGRAPTDALSRSPYFDHVYQAELKRKVNILDGQGRGQITPNQLRDMEVSARNYALAESKSLLYDLAESSRLAEMMKFVFPFFSASQEVATRWAGIAWENPTYVSRMRQIWSAPQKAGAVIDERGWEVSTDGKRARDPISGEWVAKRGQESFVLRLPEFATKNIPGLKYVGEIPISKKSANLLYQGPPGFGLAVSIPVNEIAKTRPDLEDSLKWVLPFGITEDTKSMLMPATAKRAYSLSQGDEDQKYANARMRIWTTMLVDHNLGIRKTAPTLDEATEATDAFFKLRTFVSWTSPVAMQFNSPYQAYIEIYRGATERLRDDEFALGRKDNGSAVTADEWFLDNYGEEFFPLTQTLSRSNDGVPPTMEGFLARRKYKDLIEKDPELGGLILGNEGAGEYSNFVYQNQAASRLKPGSKEKQRDFPDFNTQSVQPEVREGWIKYGRYMDLIEAERIQRGLPNLNVKAAADLAEVKKQITEDLASEFPAWDAARGGGGSKNKQKRIEAMRALAKDKRLAVRPEIAALNDYFALRDLVVGELSKRKAKSLTATSNADLAEVWDSMVGDMRERELAFSSLWFRWLENDELEVE